MSEALQLGIIGQPLTHTLSPLLHAQLMRHTERQGDYRKYELTPDELPKALVRLVESGVRGLNVTIPHKVSVMALMDWLSPEAELAGAVNTVVFEPDATKPDNFLKKGYNTDIPGFIRSLPQALIDRLPESNVMVLGAGGSARAVLAGLIQLHAGAVTFAVRNPAKAVSLVSDAEIIKQAFGANTAIHLVSLASLPSLEAFDVLINTTPVGMWPQVNESPLSPIQLETLPAGAYVYDLIYRPAETQLMKNAANLGLHTINGLDMLINQGVCAYELWQEQAVPDAVIPALRVQLQQELAKAPV